MSEDVSVPVRPSAPPEPPPWELPPESGWAPPRRMNPLAVVSLVAGCAQILFWFVGAIVAIVTGHLARHQIRRSDDEGAGMALAGLILGYVGLVLSILAAAGVASLASRLIWCNATFAT